MKSVSVSPSLSHIDTKTHKDQHESLKLKSDFKSRVTLNQIFQILLFFLLESESMEKSFLKVKKTLKKSNTLDCFRVGLISSKSLQNRFLIVLEHSSKSKLDAKSGVSLV